MKHPKLSIGLVGLFLFACTDKTEPPIHPDDWVKPGAINSHTAKIAASGIEGCQACHGGTERTDYFGGTSGISCYTCHEGGPSGHPAWAAWMDSDSPDFHGTAVISRGLGTCKSCHGEDLSGGTAKSSCVICHTESI